jgi:hypothetical protein
MVKCVARPLSERVKLVFARWQIGKVERLRHGVLHDGKLRIDAAGDDVDPAAESGPVDYEILAAFKRSDDLIELWTRTSHMGGVEIRWAAEKGDGFRQVNVLALNAPGT